MRTITIAVTTLALAGAVALAEEEKKAPATQPVNKMCAVQTEHDADPNVTTTYKDKTYAFCCKDCIPEFNKDPEKYAKNAK